MTRAQVAAFVSRALELPDSERDHFGDDAASIFHREVNALADAGITVGCAAGLFCPDIDVSRSQAASFVARAMELSALSQPNGGEDPPDGRVRSLSTLMHFR
jgi:subtilisin